MKTRKNTNATSQAAAIRELVQKAVILAQIRRVRAEVEELERLVNDKK